MSAEMVPTAPPDRMRYGTCDRLDLLFDDLPARQRICVAVWLLGDEQESTPTIWDIWVALSERLVEQGWIRQVQNRVVEKDDAMVHMDNRYGPATIMMTFDRFYSSRLTPSAETVEGYLREIAIDLECWKERDR